MRITARRHRRGRGHADPGGDSVERIEFDPGELGGLLAAPPWLRNAGVFSWLAAGVIVLLVGLVWLGSLAQAIVMPLIAATVVAAVGAPVVRWLQQRGVPRAVGTVIVLLALVVAALGMVLLIVGGVTSQDASLSGHLGDGRQKIAGWLHSLGIDSGAADQATQQTGDGASDALRLLLGGVAHGIAGLSSLVFFLALTVLSLFFLLKDGPTIRAWAERHAGVPQPIARLATRRILQSLRGYFLGVALVAGYSAVIVGIGSLIIGVPLAGTIAVVTFVGGFVPYLGAWSAGAFAVLLALGSGTEAALAMVVLQLLANGLFQQLVQPFAYGAALGIHPLAVLVVTIAGGAIFGAVGLVLAAPLTSAAVRISADVGRARAGADASEETASAETASEEAAPGGPAVAAPATP